MRTPMNYAAVKFMGVLNSRQMRTSMKLWVSPFCAPEIMDVPILCHFVPLGVPILCLPNLWVS